MPTTALLPKASANRVYGSSALDLAAAELAILDDAAIGAGLLDLRRAVLGGVDYVLVDTPEPLTAGQLAVLSNLSSLHAAFELDGDRLRPLPLTPVGVVDEDITTIQRYSGKTNEAFTHLLVNVALAASGRFADVVAGERVRLLDPACGRGTTLNRAAVYGMDACGIELDQRDVEAYTTFLLTWMKDKRFKHHLDQARLRKGRDRPAHRITVTYGATKDRASHRVIDVIHDDTVDARAHLRPRSFDLLVCDLPYGVQHGAQSSGALARGPGELLDEALPVWFDLLRPGAGVALAWNRKTLPRPALTDRLVAVGFSLHAIGEADELLHRVDRAILRDVVVARRPAP